MRQHPVGETVVGRGLEAGELGDAADPEAVLHRRDRDVAIDRDQGQANPDAGIGHHHVVAALGLDRHPAAKTAREARRPSAGSDHEQVARDRARVGEHAARPPGADVEGAHQGSPERAAGVLEVRRQHLDHAQRIDAAARFGREHAPADSRRHLGGERAYAGLVQLLHDHAAAAANVVGGAVVAE